MEEYREIGLTEIDFLLTYQCLKECDHCFVWSSPSSEDTMSLEDLYSMIRESKKLGTVEMIYFEGGEPFLYYPLLLRGLEKAKSLGFRVGIVSDGYWATSLEDAKEWLRPIASIGVSDLSLSSDYYHAEEIETEKIKNAIRAAENLGIPVTILATEPKRGLKEKGLKRLEKIEGVPVHYDEVMYRGRAATELLEEAGTKSWAKFDECPYENLENQNRIHIDPFGYVHICQGVTIGNVLEDPFSEILSTYDPRSHPIIAPLIRGGPKALVKTFGLTPEGSYVDACHLCYESRLALRDKFPDILSPDQMYGID